MTDAQFVPEEIQTLFLNYLPTSLNEYIRIERGNKYEAARIKKTETERVAWLCKSQKIKPVTDKVYITFVWVVKNRKKDPDNIAFAKKFILDGLVMAKVIKQDNLNNIVGFRDIFVVDKREGVSVMIVPLTVILKNNTNNLL